MARYLILSKKHYGTDGLIPLFSGDDWELEGKVVETEAGAVRDVDLTDYAATAYFPGDVAGSVDLVAGNAGKLSVSLSDEETPDVEQSEDGVGMYLIIEKDGITTTVPTKDQPLQVKERGE